MLQSPGREVAKGRKNRGNKTLVRIPLGYGTIDLRQQGLHIEIAAVSGR